MKRMRHGARKYVFCMLLLVSLGILYLTIPSLNEQFDENNQGFLSSNLKIGETRDIKKSTKTDADQRDNLNSLHRNEKELTVSQSGSPTYYHYVAILNTPKCGTGGLWEFFLQAFNCHTFNTDFPTVEHVVVHDCPHGNSIQRAHLVDPSAQALEQNLKLMSNPGNVNEGDEEKTSKNVDEAKCLIVSSIRDPNTWLPSLFFEKHAYLCDIAKKQDLPTDKVIEIYKDWLLTDYHFFYHKQIPFLLLEFGAADIGVELEKMSKNGGYTLLSHPSKSRELHNQQQQSQTDASDATIVSKSPFSACDLLLLRLEDHDNWPKIFEHVIATPDSGREVVYHDPEHSRREAICPALTSHYQAVREYEMTPQEKDYVIHDIPHMAKWFSAYGH